MTPRGGLRLAPIGRDGTARHPPGFHAFAQGFFFRSRAGSVAATQWDASAEDMVDAGTTLPPGAVEALRGSVRRFEMDAHLG